MVGSESHVHDVTECLMAARLGLGVNGACDIGTYGQCDSSLWFGFNPPFGQSEDTAFISPTPAERLDFYSSRATFPT